MSANGKPARPTPDDQEPPARGWGDGIFGRGDPRLLLERIFWPTLVIGGLLLFALCYAPWGRGTEGWQLGITGLGRVEVTGSTDADQASIDELQQWTDPAGLATMILAVAIVLVSLLAWWQTRLRVVGAIIVVLAGIGAIANSALVVAEPAGQLFKGWVAGAVSDEIPMSPAYGSIGAVICAAVITLWALGGLVFRIRRGLIRR